MNSFRKQKKFIGLLAVCALAFTPILQAYDTAFTDHIANRYLSTFKVIDAKEIEKSQEKAFSKQGFLDHIRQIMASRKLSLKELGQRDMVEMEFKHAQKAPQKKSVIDVNFIDKMEVIKNMNESTPADHLIYRLTKNENGDSYLQTTIGHKRFAEMLTQPVTDFGVIEQRQEIIRELVNNDKLRNECAKILKKMHASEPLFYDLHTVKELKELEKTLYFGPLFSKMGLNRPTPLSISIRLVQGLQILITLSSVIFYGGAIILGPKIKAQINQLENDAKKHQKSDKSDKSDKTEQTEQTAQEAQQLKLAAGFGVSYLGILTPLLSILGLSTMKQQANAVLNMQERLIGASTYLTGIKKLVYTLGTNSTIRAAMPELKKISQEIHYSEKKSTEFNDLNNLLSKGTFSEGKPSVFSSVGNILVAYQQFTKEAVRFEYADAKNIAGELDVYVALAQKIKEHAHSKAQFSFVQLEKDADKPMIKTVDFWNPFIALNKVVTNTINFNTGAECNMILTGPNTGGKSTTMKALMINALLAQTFGIAAAKSMTMSIFAKLTSYLNISDDTASGISLFKAEVKRAQELMETLRNLEANEFAFVIIDEIFTGTAPEKAEELSYKFIKQLSEFKNVIFIDATHFKKLVDLEKETNGICKNYHTGVIIDPANPSKVAKYTYKLTPGPSPINNAEQVAEEAGITF